MFFKNEKEEKYVNRSTKRNLSIECRSKSVAGTRLIYRSYGSISWMVVVEATKEDIAVAFSSLLGRERKNRGRCSENTGNPMFLQSLRLMGIEVASVES